MFVQTEYQHVILDDKQVPTIIGTTMKVIELVLDSKAYGWSPEELQFQHSYLTMGQIHSALAYYWDHQEELDKDIEEGLQFIDELQRKSIPTSLERRLREEGLI